MVTKLKVILVLLLVHMATCYTTCKNCAGIAFSFAITNRIYPDKDSIHVGDTIWMEVDVPTRLLNLSSSGSSINTEVDYAGAINLGTPIEFINMDKDYMDDSKYAAFFFKTHLVIGDSVINNQFNRGVKSFRFKEINGRYIFKVGFIALEKGDYMISPGDAAGVYRHKDKCTKAAFSITIADTDQHHYLFYENYPDTQLGPMDLKNIYCVRVK